MTPSLFGGSTQAAARLSTTLLLTIITGLFAATSAAQVSTEASAETGLSAKRLDRINQVFERAIEADQVSGAVTLVSRRGKVAHFEAHGRMDIEHDRPMDKDAIFAIASMTKPVTGVAILMLMEEGKVRLTDPVSRFIPEFRDPRVAIYNSSSDAGPNDAERDVYTVPAAREVTVFDLMTHTSGLESGGAASRESARVAPRRVTDTLAEYAAALGAAPLDFQPGTQWAYSGLGGIDTLGRIVEVASGLTFDEFLRQRIFEPLGMHDTAFNVPADRQSRVATYYRSTRDGLQRHDFPEWATTRSLFSGGAGLWATAEDYLQFAQMLVNGGELNGTRLLSPRTIDLMATNHVGDLYAASGRTGGRRGMGFGLTVDVMLDGVKAQDRRSDGSFGWRGAFGTHFWVDQKEELTAIMMVQTPDSLLRADFQNAVMQAIVD